jgi:hypothetical protein
MTDDEQHRASGEDAQSTRDKAKEVIEDRLNFADSPLAEALRFFKGLRKRAREEPLEGRNGPPKR